MANLLDTIVVWLFLATIASVCYDVYTYETRQDKWEKAHPGATYIRNYRKFEKESLKARRMGGEV